MSTKSPEAASVDTARPVEVVVPRRNCGGEEQTKGIGSYIIV